MTDLVPKMTQHGAVRLTETHPQRLAVGVQGFRQIDGDHPAGMTDHDLLSGAVAGQQVEGEPAFSPPERVHRKSDIQQLIDESAQVN